MPKIEVRAEHQLTPQEAAERLRRFGEQLKQKHGEEVTILKEEWGDETLDFSLWLRASRSADSWSRPIDR